MDSHVTSLFHELYDPLCIYCMRLVGSKDVAEDIVQEQFVYIWKNNKILDGKASIKAYLYTTVKHRSIDYLKQKFARNKESLDDISAIYLVDSLPDPEEILENKELEAIINKAIASLPKKCRIIFRMKKFGELTNKEIAYKLNISVKTVENQMTIALKKLIVFISDRWN